MDLTPYVDRLHRDLGVAAAAGGEQAQAMAERLVAPLDATVRLVLLEALSAAADEITTELLPGSVAVRLRGGAPTFVVTPAPPAPADVPPAPAPPESPYRPLAGGEPGDDGATARINFRLPEFLKVRVEEAAAAEGLSVNAWLTRAVSATLAPPAGPARGPDAGSGGRARFTGWVR